MLLPQLKAYENSSLNKENVYVFDDIRITLLTDKIIRVEKCETKNFVDYPSKSVINRNTPTVDAVVKTVNNKIYITTSSAIFLITKNLKFKVSFDGGKTFIPPKDNLLGTRRTLDFCFTKVKLDKGILSRSGFSLLDDSNSPLFIDGKIVKRDNNGKDFYLFASLDYLALLKDFYLISGNSPMLPRYAFGNFWSRYYPYTQEEYINLMQRFFYEKIPLSVAVIDMDWHYVKLKEQFTELYKNYPTILNRGKLGWTGYTFNEKLIPNPKGFLDKLHQMGLYTTLNLHPAQGVLPHEKQYPVMLEKLGGKTGEPISFNFENDNFINHYFETLHKPLEDTGVDFWWIDWQQGRKTKLCGVDPLLSLNHYHYQYSLKNNKRGLILSRYASIGSHRYPIGFSGDSVINYAILNFIPYFTSTSSNIGFTLWSHDIGGHMFGAKSDELYVRWLQFGVLSPINRLHSSNMAVTGKEPWNTHKYSEEISKKYLRLRHKLIPYLYSQYVKNTNCGVPLIMPLYYLYDNDNAYIDKNSYLLGDQLLVHPMTTRMDKKSCLAVEKCYIPENDFIDIFTNKTYSQGNTFIARELCDTPVLIKKGGILPLNRSFTGVSNPNEIELIINIGNGSYSLYEDDGITRNYENGTFTKTNFVGNENGNTYTLNISSLGDVSVLPKCRSYIVKPINIINADTVTLFNGKETVILNKKIILGKTLFYENEDDILSFDKDCEIIPSNIYIFLKKRESFSNLTLTISNTTKLDNGHFVDNVTSFFSKLSGNNIIKNIQLNSLLSCNNKFSAIKKIKSLPISSKNKNALIEIANYSIY